MEGIKPKVLAMAGVCALLVLGFAASDVNAACSISQLAQCADAVENGSIPSQACCAQVAGVTDFNCFCDAVLRQRNLPPRLVNNALRVPMECGNLGLHLRNRACGPYLIP